MFCSPAASRTFTVRQDIFSQDMSLSGTSLFSGYPSFRISLRFSTSSLEICIINRSDTATRSFYSEKLFFNFPLLCPLHQYLLHNDALHFPSSQLSVLVAYNKRMARLIFINAAKEKKSRTDLVSRLLFTL